MGLFNSLFGRNSSTAVDPSIGELKEHLAYHRRSLAGLKKLPFDEARQAVGVGVNLGMKAVEDLVSEGLDGRGFEATERLRRLSEKMAPTHLYGALGVSLYAQFLVILSFQDAEASKEVAADLEELQKAVPLWARNQGTS